MNGLKLSSRMRSGRTTTATFMRNSRTFATVSQSVLQTPTFAASGFPYEDFYRSIVDAKKTDKSYRYFRSITRLQEEFPLAICSNSGKKVNVWCTNDYLAMGSNPSVLQAMRDTLQIYGANSGGSRNLAGHSPLAEALESSIATLHKKEAALYFGSGFAANEAALSTLGSQIPGCVIFSDELNHASMLDGIRHSRAKKHVWKHNSLAHLESLLAAYPKDVPKIIAFESVYSMCGTVAPIEKICDLAEKYGAITYLDETHAVGLYGPHGAGVAEHLDFDVHHKHQPSSSSSSSTTTTVMDRVNIIQATVSKGFGTVGGYITGSAAFIDMVRSVARGFIFTTTQTPAVMAGATAAIAFQKQHMEPRTKLQQSVAAVKQEMARFDLPVLPNPSHLVPVMVGDAQLSQRIADILFEDFGIYVQPINSPTVRIGMERFRISPTAAHTPAQQQQLIEALVSIWKRFGLRTGAEWIENGAWTAEDVADVEPLWTREQLRVGAMSLPATAEVEHVAGGATSGATSGGGVSSSWGKGLEDTLLTSLMLEEESYPKGQNWRTNARVDRG